jgi:hypothetical protein
MYVFAEVGISSDLPYWITRDDFFKYFDQEDFNANREAASVAPAYLKAWFHEMNNGDRKFYIPIAGAVGRRTDLIGTRHRLAVILPHVDPLPIAFATGHLTTMAQRTIAAIPKRPLDPEIAFWIPDFPIRDNLP